MCIDSKGRLKIISLKLTRKCLQNPTTLTTYKKGKETIGDLGRSKTTFHLTRADTGLTQKSDETSFKHRRTNGTQRMIFLVQPSKEITKDVLRLNWWVLTTQKYLHSIEIYTEEPICRSWHSAEKLWKGKSCMLGNFERYLVLIKTTGRSAVSNLKRIHRTCDFMQIHKFRSLGIGENYPPEFVNVKYFKKW